MLKRSMILKLKEIYDEKGKITRNIIRGRKDCKSVSKYIEEFGDMQTALGLAGIDYFKNQEKFLKDIGITKEYLRRQLKNFNDNIGFPTIRLLDAYSDTYPTTGVYLNVYWCIEEAIRDAGIDIPATKINTYRKYSYSDEQLLDMLKKENLIRMSDKTKLMTLEDIDKNKNMPHSSTYHCRFGSIENMYKLIGINYSEYNLHCNDDYFIECYKNIREEMGKIPTSRDLDKYSTINKCPSASAYNKHFGSLLKFQINIGDKPIKWATTLSNQELLDMLVGLKNDLGITPTQKDLANATDLPHSTIYINRFGSYLNAIRMAGLTPRSNKKVLITPNGNTALSGYEYKYMLMLEKYRIKFKKEELYKKYISTCDKNYRFDFVLNINDNIYFIEIFGIIASSDYDKRKEDKIKMCKENNINLISLFPDDIVNNNIDELYKLTLKNI